MPSASELGDVMLQALTSLFRFLETFFIYLRYTGNNETAINASRDSYQSFWEIWYQAGGLVKWLTWMFFGKYGYVWNIGNNSTLESEFAQAVDILMGNSTAMVGDIHGNNSTAFLLKVAYERLTSHPDAVYYFWKAVAEMIRLVSDALRYFPTYFPPG